MKTKIWLSLTYELTEGDALPTLRCPILSLSSALFPS